MKIISIKIEGTGEDTSEIKNVALIPEVTDRDVMEKVCLEDTQF